MPRVIDDLMVQQVLTATGKGHTLALRELEIQILDAVFADRQDELIAVQRWAMMNSVLRYTDAALGLVAKDRLGDVLIQRMPDRKGGLMWMASVGGHSATHEKLPRAITAAALMDRIGRGGRV